ncbi:MAG: enoyl-CoA hydratase-related protein, partial [Paucibacter sp.]|nr:enoyl-CoA hydratase-related protein [Roseateles sp.]
GLAGCDMGACSILPRIVGQGRASDLLYSGRSLGGEEGLSWGFMNRLVEPERLLPEALEWAQQIAGGPSFAHAMTKKMLHQEWAMGVDEAIESEAQAQAICMMTQDFHRAYHAFVAKQRPEFQGD